MKRVLLCGTITAIIIITSVIMLISLNNHNNALCVITSYSIHYTKLYDDKFEIPTTAKAFYDLGFTLYATKGTAKILNEQGIPAKPVDKIHESDNNTITLIESGKIDYVISTSSKGRIPTRDSVKIRRKTVERNIPCLTSIDTANAIAASLKSKFSELSTELVNINDMRTEKQKLEFTKMQGCGNDYIYFNCFDQRISYNFV